MDDTLYIVTGASGKLGSTFIEKLIFNNKKVIGLSRTSLNLPIPTYVCDLVNEQDIDKVIRDVSYKGIENLILIHTVGKFKFHLNQEEVKDLNADGIDDEIYETNVLTLKNIIKAILLNTKNINLKVCAFSSVTDKYEIPYWTSYRLAKKIMKKYLKELCSLGKIKALVVNVSTVDTGNENILRPAADKTYWLNCEEVVRESLFELQDLFSYEEIDVVKHKPDFDESYYLDHEKILNKWKKEMGRS